MSVKVKICGITNAADAVAAAEANADLIGFVFYDKSARHVAVRTAAEIARELPPHLIKVGVFVNPQEELVLSAIGACGLNLLQFHGDESAEYCGKFGLMNMKAFRIRDAQSLTIITEYHTDAWLLDAYSPERPGGTGQKFNWDIAVQAKQFGCPIFLAGGLTPDNVAEAVAKVRPYGVDVSGGVESSPGKKDAAKIRAFVQAAKSSGGGK